MASTEKPLVRYRVHLETTTRNFLPRPARNERGEGWGEGKSNKTKLLSPTLSSSFVGREGEARFRFRRWLP